jgi:hypothetical protein
MNNKETGSSKDGIGNAESAGYSGLKRGMKNQPMACTFGLLPHNIKPWFYIFFINMTGNFPFVVAALRLSLIFR